MGTIWQIDIENDETAVQLISISISPNAKCPTCHRIIDPENDDFTMAMYWNDGNTLPDFIGHPFVKQSVADEIKMCFPEFETRPFFLSGTPPGSYEANDDHLAEKLQKWWNLPRHCPPYCRIWAKKLFDVHLFGKVRLEKECSECNISEYEIIEKDILKYENFKDYSFFGIRNQIFTTQWCYYCTDKFRDFILSKNYTGCHFISAFEIERK
jgi:hypothetical protein